MWCDASEQSVSVEERKVKSDKGSEEVMTIGGRQREGQVLK